MLLISTGPLLDFFGRWRIHLRAKKIQVSCHLQKHCIISKIIANRPGSEQSV